jgi:hypothetical protein
MQMTQIVSSTRTNRQMQMMYPVCVQGVVPVVTTVRQEPRVQRKFENLCNR